MATNDTTKTFRAFSGFIQNFGEKDKPAITSREVNTVNGTQVVRSMTIRDMHSARYVSVTVWPEYDHVNLKAGDKIDVDGRFTTNVKDNVEYWSVSVDKLAVTQGEVKQETPRRTVAAPAVADAVAPVESFADAAVLVGAAATEEMPPF